MTPFCLQAEQFANKVLEGALTADSESAIMRQAIVMDALFESDKTKARVKL